MAKTITSLVKYFRFRHNYIFAIKNLLYMAKIFTSLPITYNNSKITWKSNLAIDFSNFKVV